MFFTHIPFSHCYPHHGKITAAPFPQFYHIAEKMIVSLKFWVKKIFEKKWFNRMDTQNQLSKTIQNWAK